MRVLDLLRQVYREIGMLETSRRQKNMIIADNAGVKAIRYDKDKVSGGQQGDLADVLLNIERERERIDEQIARQLERVMRHRAELYQLIEKVPDGPGKAAVQEHYLYRVPWGGGGGTAALWEGLYKEVCLSMCRTIGSHMAERRPEKP